MSWFNHWLALNLVCNNNIFVIVSRFSVAFLDFFAKAQEGRELIKNRELNLSITPSPVSPYQNYHISVSIRKSAKRSLHSVPRLSRSCYELLFVLIKISVIPIRTPLCVCTYASL